MCEICETVYERDWDAKVQLDHTKGRGGSRFGIIKTAKSGEYK